MTRATLVLLLAGLGLVATMPLRPSQSLTAGRTPPNASTRPLDAFRAGFPAFSLEAAGGGAFTPADGGSRPLGAAVGRFTSASGQEAGDTTGGAGDRLPSSAPPDHAALDLASFALATPLVGFGGLHPVSESWSRGVASGIASTVGSRFPDWYLALPIGPGFRVRIVGAGGSVERVSTDAGPALHLQRRPYNRVADLSVRDFIVVCGVPASFGLCQVSISVLGRVR